MKVIFAGPSLHGHSDRLNGGEILPPASQGDLHAAVLNGANVIGLVDGLYESVAAVWHKEILFALSQGVVVLGAASMGALRAAECHAFGMQPVGEIAHRYLSGDLTDDAAVAQLHAPLEFGFAPLTEALVDCEATIQSLLSTGDLDPPEAAALGKSAIGMFFKSRTWPLVIQSAGFAPSRERELITTLKSRRRSLKREDAIQLFDIVQKLPDNRCCPPSDWRFAQTHAWRRSIGAVLVGDYDDLMG